MKKFLILYDDLNLKNNTFPSQFILKIKFSNISLSLNFEKLRKNLQYPIGSEDIFLIDEENFKNLKKLSLKFNEVTYFDLIKFIQE